MSEIEMAIGAIETAFEQEPPAIVEDGYGFYLVIEDALATALAALREQAEREKECTHCQKPYVSIGGINEDKAIIYLGAERPYTKGNVEYLHHMGSAGRMNAFKVRYCPMCGKQLEVKHDG